MKEGLKVSSIIHNILPPNNLTAAQNLHVYLFYILWECSQQGTSGSPGLTWDGDG